MRDSKKIFFVALIFFLFMPISQVYVVNNIKANSLEQSATINRNIMDPISNLNYNDAKIQNLAKNNYANRTITNKRSTNQILTTTSGNYTTGFISTWNTNESGVSNDTQITLPLLSTGTYNFTVAWGDGQIDTIQTFNSINTTHTYATSGIYTINITGELIGWSFNRAGDVQKLIGISHWGNLRLGNTGDYFAGATNLVLTATDPLNLNGTTTLRGAFEYCYNLGSKGNMDSWNTSGITDMANMFGEDYSFNQGIDQWDVSHVTHFQNMFNVDYMVSIKGHFPSFSQNLDNWNVSHAINMSRMFQGQRVFDPSLANWNTSQVTNMSLMFTDCLSFNNFFQPLNWDVSHVQDMSFMFAATEYNQPLNNWNVSSVTDMKGMFLFTQMFNQPLNNWNVASVTDMQEMFYGDIAFNQNLNSWNVSSVLDMQGMFKTASAFNQPLNLWDVSHVTNMSNMFENDQAFNQNLNSWNVSNVLDMQGMFKGTNAFNMPLNNWDVSHVTDMSFLFFDNSNFNQNLNSWNVSRVQSMNYMFDSDFSFNMPLNNWQVSNVRDMSGIFKGATRFNQPVNNWNVLNVRNMSYMFESASSFNQPVNNWNVSKVTDMTGMFKDSTSFDQDIGSWNISNVHFMNNMLHNVILSVSNYDRLLNGWSKLPLRSSVTFDAGNSSYDSSAVTSRNYIIQTFNWTIIDGGLAKSTQSFPSILQLLGLIVLVMLVAIITGGLVLFIKLDKTGPEAKNKRNFREYLKNKLLKKTENHKEKISDETFEMMETIIKENEGK